MTTKRQLFEELKAELEADSSAGRETFDFQRRHREELRKMGDSLKQSLHRRAMPALVDDNFGHWEINDEDDIDFYVQVQAESVEKTCEGCGGTFNLRPEYGYCNSCADKREKGWDF